MLASAAFGALMLVAAVLVIVDAAALPDTGAVVGPAAVPLPVGVLLGLARHRPARALVDRAARRAYPGTPGSRVRGLRVARAGRRAAAFALLLPLLGYVVSSAALFVGRRAAARRAARVDRSSPTAGPWRPSVFLVFDRLIGLTLPAGPWGF